ncbi:MAG: VCBS repeat-containing protein [Saprospiraceae bacterium]
MNINYLFCLLIAVCLPGCRNEKSYSNAKKEGSIFRRLSSQETGIDFTNTVQDEKGSNFLLYEYFYNGAGVGVGDFNNDGLDDIFLAGNQVPDKLYLNKGGLKFEDITATSGITKDNSWSTGVTVGDFNGDGFLDIYVCKSGNIQRYSNIDRENKLYINNHDLTFTESAKAMGLNDAGYGTHAALIDIDNDGDQDVYVLNHQATWRNKTNYSYEEKIKQFDEFTTDHLYENIGGKFVDISKQAGIEAGAFGLSVNVADINQDGWLDLYVANDYWIPDFLYINNKDRTFTNRSKEYFKHLSLFGMGSDIQDFNNDGLSDIIVVDMMPDSDYRRKTHEPPADFDKLMLHVNEGYHYQYKRNTLQLNRGNNRFSEIGQLSGVAYTDWSWATLFGDFDNDGLKDLLICNGFRRDYSDWDFMKYDLPEFINKKGGLGNFDNMDVLQVIPVVKLRNYAYKNMDGLQFKDESIDWGLEEEGFSNGAAYADLDNDGDLDLIINNINDQVLFYENTTNQQQNTGFLNIRFANNIVNQALNATLKLTINGQAQYVDFRMQRGYMSSLPATVHFGFPKNSNLNGKKLEIFWQDGSVEELHDFELNTQILITAKKGTPRDTIARASEKYKVLFDSIPLPFYHTENPFIDFNAEKIIPRMYSREGPGLSVADFDGTGKPAIILGGAQDAPTFLYKNWDKQLKQEKLPLDDACENVDIVEIDLNRDGLLDLYFVNGGNERPEGSAGLQDEILMNIKGNFTKVENKTNIAHNKSCAVKIDYDKDGYDDVVVAGGVKPLAYPTSYPSHLLKNEAGTLVEVPNKTLNTLNQFGIIKSIAAIDYNKDGWTDLVAAGHWSPIIFIKNNQGVFELDKTMDNYAGFWNTLEVSDLDNDGDLDIIAGNLGLNGWLKPGLDSPLEVFAYDFNNDERIDPLINYYENGKSYLIYYRDQLFGQISGLHSNFTDYKGYAQKGIRDVYPKEVLDKAYHRKVNYQSSAIFENKGNGEFTAHPLPILAQIAPVQSIVANDLDGDGFKDLVLVGNDYTSNGELGRYDAGYGLLLMGRGQCRFEVVDNHFCNLYLEGDARKARIVDLPGGKFLLVAFNNGKMQAYHIIRNQS